MPKTSEKNGQTKIIFDVREEKLINECGRLAKFVERNATPDSPLAILAANLAREHAAFVGEYNRQFAPDPPAAPKNPAPKDAAAVGSGSGKGSTASSE